MGSCMKNSKQSVKTNPSHPPKKQRKPNKKEEEDEKIEEEGHQDKVFQNEKKCSKLR